MSYLKRHGTRRVPQWAPLPGQVRTRPAASPGRSTCGRGCAASSSSAPRAARYYASEWTLTRENAKAVEECVARGRPARGRGDRARRRRRAARRRTTRRCSRSRSRPASATPRRGRRRSTALPQVAPHGHAPVPVRRCSSRASAAGAARCGARSAAGTRRRPVDALAYQAVKYRQREGVTHRDLLRLAHPARRVGAGNPALDVSDEHARLFEWIVRGGETDGLPRLVEGFARAQEAATPRRGGRARPRVPPAARGAPAGAPDLARGLGGAARRDADDGADPQPGDDDARRRARAGLGRHGARWSRSSATRSASARRGCTRSPCSPRSARTRRVAACAAAASGSRCGEVVDALDAAFYTAFGNVEPAGKRLLLALDVSGSMTGGHVAGVPGLTPARRVGGARAGDGRDRAAVRDRRLLRRQGRLQASAVARSGRATATG